MDWTPEDKETVRKLVAKGFKAADIGRQLNPRRTKNSIIGVVHRLGLKFPTTRRTFYQTQTPSTPSAHPVDSPPDKESDD